jgi:glycosyltransferase involved in cell wall biosynthesis
MARYEKAALRRFDRVVAVSGRDAEHFEKHYAVHEPRVIATGVDLDFFTYSEPDDSDQCVFTGSMDWLANIDAVKFLMDSVWPEIVRRRASARMAVVGRSPPSDLVERARSKGLGWEFSGFVDDVRPWVRRSAVSLIPLRIGGGTRLKVYEAMALGCPVVSTSIGVEGLKLEPGREYLRADDPIGFAEAVVALMADRERARTLSRAARDHVERHASHRSVAHEFERICLETCAKRTGTAFTPGYRDGQERLRSFAGQPLPER